MTGRGSSLCGYELDDEPRVEVVGGNVQVLREEKWDGGERCDVVGRNGRDILFCRTHLIWVAMRDVASGSDTLLSVVIQYSSGAGVDTRNINARNGSKRNGFGQWDEVIGFDGTEA